MLGRLPLCGCRASTRARISPQAHPPSNHHYHRATTPAHTTRSCVTPYLVVPGPWSDSDLEYHADSLAAGLTNNAGRGERGVARGVVRASGTVSLSVLLHTTQD